MGWNSHKNEKNFPVASSGHLKSVWNVILDVNPLVRFKKKKKNSPPKEIVMVCKK